MQKEEGKTTTEKRNTTAPNQWVEQYADYFYAYTIARINDEELARDLVQETFLAGLERLDRFEGKSTERTWLTAILRNKIVDVYRQRSSGLNNDNAISNIDEQDDFFNADDGHWKETHYPKEFARTPDDQLLAKEFHIVLRRCMNKLPSLWIAVFTMKHMDELATENICKELKVTAANFWVIVHRTKLNLRACLQKNWT
ncbi:MAG: sigma-70 family RNA polymerase sigma factor [Chitinophagaceae bacterium]|nr:sigma-70 family RNA polymerase sigma factor [Chitinophagaceae bacterium]